MKITSFMLILIVAISTIGLNILSYCCSHKEIGVFVTSSYTLSEASHEHHIHCSIGSDCCSINKADNHSCCLHDSHDHEADDNDISCTITKRCMKNDFIQLKPVKLNEYLISFITPLPIILELFDFNPEINVFSEFPIIASDSPPNECGRKILALNATLLI